MDNDAAAAAAAVLSPHRRQRCSSRQNVWTTTTLCFPSSSSSIIFVLTALLLLLSHVAVAVNVTFGGTVNMTLKSSSGTGPFMYDYVPAYDGTECNASSNFSPPRPFNISISLANVSSYGMQDSYWGYLLIVTLLDAKGVPFASVGNRPGDFLNTQFSGIGGFTLRVRSQYLQPLSTIRVTLGCSVPSYLITNTMGLVNTILLANTSFQSLAIPGSGTASPTGYTISCEDAQSRVEMYSDVFPSEPYGYRYGSGVLFYGLQLPLPASSSTSQRQRPADSLCPVNTYGPFYSLSSSVDFETISSPTHYLVFRCVYVYTLSSVDTASMASMMFPAVIRSDADGAGSASWMNYVDSPATTEWKLSQISYPCNSAAGEIPTLTVMNMTVASNGMVDTSWGSPGYRTILSFINSGGGMPMLAFGDRTTQIVQDADVTLPDLAVIRLRLYGTISAVGFDIHLECKPAFSTSSSPPSIVVAAPGLPMAAYSAGVECLRFRCSNNMQLELSVADASLITVLDGGRGSVQHIKWPSSSSSSSSDTFLYSLSSAIDVCSLALQTISYRCVNAYIGAYTSGRGVSLPAVILSDMDGVGGKSWMSYPDTPAVSNWNFNPCPLGTEAFLEELNLDVMPNMQDWSWGTAGYRTILSFADVNGSEIAGYGNLAKQNATVSMPGLGSMRLRIWGGQSARGFQIKAQCIPQTCGNSNRAVNAAYYANFDEEVVAVVGSATCNVITCSADANAQVKLTLVSSQPSSTSTTQIFGTWSDSVTPRPDGVYYSRSNRMTLTATLSAPPTIRYRCVYVYPQFNGGGGGVLLRLPAMVLSDLDGVFDGSWVSFPDIVNPIEWTVNASSSCRPGTHPVLRYLNLSMMPGMDDGSWGTAGYRTILTFFDSRNAPIASFGNLARQYVTNLSLPSLAKIRLRVWFGQSAPGYEFHIACDPDASNPAVLTAANPTVMTVNATWSTATVLIPTSSSSYSFVVNISCSVAPEAQVEVTVPVAAIGFVTVPGGSVSRFTPSGTIYSWSSGGILLSSAVAVVVKYRCMYVYRQCASAVQTNISLPAVILSDVDGPGEESWMAYPDASTFCSWTVTPPMGALSGSGCVDGDSVPTLRFMNLSVQPNMQDTSWGSPGYRTILSFMDRNQAVLAAFGNERQVIVENVSLPMLGSIRQRVWAFQSERGYQIHLDCVPRTCPAGGGGGPPLLTTSFGRPPKRINISGDATTMTSCLPLSCASRGGQLQIDVAVFNRSRGAPPCVMAVGASAAMANISSDAATTTAKNSGSSKSLTSTYFSFGSNATILMWCGGNVTITYQCKYVYRHCGQSNAVQTVYVPAVVLSDVDGDGGTSWFSHYDATASCRFLLSRLRGAVQELSVVRMSPTVIGGVYPAASHGSTFTFVDSNAIYIDSFTSMWNFSTITRFSEIPSNATELRITAQGGFSDRGYLLMLDIHHPPAGQSQTLTPTAGPPSATISESREWGSISKSLTHNSISPTASDVSELANRTETLPMRSTSASFAITGTKNTQTLSVSTNLTKEATGTAFSPATSSPSVESTITSSDDCPDDFTFSLSDVFDGTMLLTFIPRSTIVSFNNTAQGATTAINATTTAVSMQFGGGGGGGGGGVKASIPMSRLSSLPGLRSQFGVEGAPQDLILLLSTRDRFHWWQPAVITTIRNTSVLFDVVSMGSAASLFNVSIEVLPIPSVDLLFESSSSRTRILCTPSTFACDTLMIRISLSSAALLQDPPVSFQEALRRIVGGQTTTDIVLAGVLPWTFLVCGTRQLPRSNGVDDLHLPKRGIPFQFVISQQASTVINPSLVSVLSTTATLLGMTSGNPSMVVTVTRIASLRSLMSCSPSDFAQSPGNNILGWSIGPVDERMQSHLLRGGVVGNLVVLVGLIIGVFIAAVMLFLCMVGVIGVFSPSSSSSFAGWAALMSAIEELQPVVHFPSTAVLPLSAFLIPTLQSAVSLVWSRPPGYGIASGLDVLIGLVAIVVLLALSSWWAYHVRSSDVPSFRCVAEPFGDVSRQEKATRLAGRCPFPFSHSEVLFRAFYRTFHWVPRETSRLKRRDEHEEGGGGGGGGEHRLKQDGGASLLFVSRRWKRQMLFMFHEYNSTRFVLWDLISTVLLAIISGCTMGVVMSWSVQHHGGDDGTPLPTAPCVIPIVLLLVYYVTWVVLLARYLPMNSMFSNTIAFLINLSGAAIAAASLVVTITSVAASSSSSSSSTTAAAAAVNVVLIASAFISVLVQVKTVVDAGGLLYGAVHVLEALVLLARSVWSKERPGSPALALRIHDLLGRESENGDGAAADNRSGGSGEGELLEFTSMSFSGRSADGLPLVEQFYDEAMTSGFNAHYPLPVGDDRSVFEGSLSSPGEDDLLAAYKRTTTVLLMEKEEEEERNKK